MKKLTEEEFLQEIKIVEQKRSQFLSTGNHLDCFKCDEILRGLNVLVHGDLNYWGFKYSYEDVKGYFEKKYKTEIELPDFIRKKAPIFFDFLNPEVFYPKISSTIYFSTEPFLYGLSNTYLEGHEKEFEAVRKFFSDKKRNYVFTWELEYLVHVLYYEKVSGLNFTESLFGEPRRSNDDTLNELKRNAEYILREVKEKQRLDLSLFLWTIYRTYYFFINKYLGVLIQRECFSLIGWLLDCCFLFFDHGGAKFSLVESSISKKEQGLINKVCGRLSQNLLTTIVFYDYSSSYVYGLNIADSCEGESLVSMESFDSFFEGVCKADFWVPNDEMLDYEKMHLSEELPIQKDYDRLIKKIFDEQQLVDYLKQFKSIAWYPSASRDSLSMACLSNKSLKKYGIPKNEVPDCFIFTDYETFSDQRDNKRFFLDLEENNDEVSFDNLSDDCHATAFNVRELGQLSIPFDKSLVTHDCDKYYGRVFLADVLIEHPKIGKTIAKLVYIIAENTAFAFDFLIKNDIRIKYVIHSNYGYGFGGGISNGTFICNILKDLGARYFVSDINQNYEKDIADSYLNDDQRKTLPVLKEIVDFNREYKWYGYDNTILYEITGYKRSDDKNESGK